MLEWTTVIVATISALFGGGLTTILSNRQDSFKLVLGALHKENEELQQKIRDYSFRIEDLSNKIRKQELQLIALESSHFAHPWPSWIKDVDGRFIIVNTAFEDLILKPNGFLRYDCIGKTDDQLWPEPYAKQYKASDYEVLSSKTVWENVESFPIIPLEIEEKIWVIKYPIILGSAVVGIAGTCVPLKQVLRKLEK